MVSSRHSLTTIEQRAEAPRRVPLLSWEDVRVDTEHDFFDALVAKTLLHDVRRDAGCEEQ